MIAPRVIAFVGIVVSDIMVAVMSALPVVTMCVIAFGMVTLCMMMFAMTMGPMAMMVVMITYRPGRRHVRHQQHCRQYECTK